MQRNAWGSLCQKCAAVIAKHPAADRGLLTITYWLLYCKYILLVSSKSSSLSCLWMFWGPWGGLSQYIPSTMAGDELEIPLVGFSGRSQEKTHNLSIRCQDLPLRPQPADPNWPMRGSEFPAAHWVHRCIELPCSSLPQFLTDYLWAECVLQKDLGCFTLAFGM